MGGRGANYNATEQKIRKALKDEENDIRNYPVEWASIIGTDGSVILKKTDNDPGQVSFTSKQASMFKDGVFTHNHPNGTVFSDADLNVAITTGLREMRACNATGFFSLRRQFEIGSTIPKKYFDFAKDYANAEKEYKKNVTDVEWAQSAQTESDANRLNNKVEQFRRDWLRKNSLSYGWKFSEGTI